MLINRREAYKVYMAKNGVCTGNNKITIIKIYKMHVSVYLLSEGQITQPPCPQCEWKNVPLLFNGELGIGHYLVWSISM
jgi:hypothetical protein